MSGLTGGRLPRSEYGKKADALEEKLLDLLRDETAKTRRPDYLSNQEIQRIYQEALTYYSNNKERFNQKYHDDKAIIEIVAYSIARDIVGKDEHWQNEAEKIRNDESVRGFDANPAIPLEYQQNMWRSAFRWRLLHPLTDAVTDRIVLTITPLLLKEMKKEQGVSDDDKPSCSVM